MTRSRRFALAVLFAAAWLGPALADPPAALAAQPTKLIKGPYVTNFSDTTADVRFELDAPGPATLQVGRAPAGTPTRKFTDATVTANHLIHVTDLEATKSYVYAVALGSRLVAKGELTTALPSNSAASVKFILYGDDRSDPAAHEAIVRAIEATPSQFVVNTGDVVEDGGSAADWQSFFTIEAPLLRERPILLCIGNHELYDDEAGSNFARYFGFADASGASKPYGTARIGATRFFFLNGMHDWDSGEERAWLERELTRADTDPGLLWRIAVVHHSPWSSGPHGPNKRLVAAHIPELLAAHKVDLLFAGHDHIYERGDAGIMRYMISGGGGAPLYRITQPTAMTKKAEGAYHFVEVTISQYDVRTVAHRLDGSVLEKCGFLKGQPWDCDPVASGSALAPAASTSAGSSGALAPPATAPSAVPGRSSHCAAAAPGVGSLGTRAGLGAVALGLVAALAFRRRRRRG